MIILLKWRKDYSLVIFMIQIENERCILDFFNEKNVVLEGLFDVMMVKDNCE